MVTVALGEAWIFNTEDWSEVARWDAHDGLIRGVELSPDGRSLATAGEDERVRIWDLADILDGAVLESGAAPQLLDDIPTDVISDVRWIAQDRLGLVGRDGTWTTVSLDPGALVAGVLDRLTRSFSARECQTYHIDPCPTLEKLKSR